MGLLSGISDRWARLSYCARGTNRVVKTGWTQAAAPPDSVTLARTYVSVPFNVYFGVSDLSVASTRPSWPMNCVVYLKSPFCAMRTSSVVGETITSASATPLLASEFYLPAKP